MNRTLVCTSAAVAVLVHVKTMINLIPRCMGILVVLIVLDMALGLTKGYLSSSLSSAKCAKGIGKKIAILSAICVSHCLDRLMGIDTLFQMACFFYIASESISIFENCGQLGIPIPKKLRDAIDVLNK